MTGMQGVGNFCNCTRLQNSRLSEGRDEASSRRGRETDVPYALQHQEEISVSKELKNSARHVRDF